MTQAVACADTCTPTDTIACNVPSDCGGSTPTCCVTAVLNGGNLPNCNAKSLNSVCTATADCPSQIGFSCHTTDTVPLCTSTAADCSGGDQCCQITEAGETVMGCVSGTIAGFLTCN